MNALLIQPPDVLGSRYYEPPLSLLYLASSLSRQGIITRICDMRLAGEKELIFQLNKAPDIVGFSTTSYTMSQVARYAKLVWLNSPESTIILGGAHATYAPEETIKTVPEASYIVLGEAEEILCKLVHRLQEEPRRVASLMNVWSVDNPQPYTPRYADMDTIPFASQSLVKLGLSKVLSANPYVPMIASRGCFYKCKFCLSPSYWGKIRIRSFANIKQELREYAQMGAMHINFRDDAFLMIPKVKNTVVPILGEMGFEWSCETRVDHLDVSSIESLIGNGMRKIRVSIETIHQKSHYLLGKGKMPDLVMAQKTIRALVESGIDVRISFMVGIPGETISDIHKTLMYAENLKPAICKFWAFTPLPGSVFFENPKYFGLQRTCIGDFHPKRSSIQTDHLRAKDIDEILAIAEDRFPDPTWKNIYYE